LAFSFTAGISRPIHGPFRELYGGAQVPFSLEVDYRLFGRFHPYAGFRHVSSSGETRVIEPEFEPESYPLNFKMDSARFGLSVGFPLRRFTLLAGAGAGYNSYRERIEDMGLSIKGHAFGFQAHAAADYPLNRRFSLIGRFEFSTIPASEDPATGTKINLGSVDLSFGLAVKL
jgi:opacity protein-like surface antigen